MFDSMREAFSLIETIIYVAILAMFILFAFLLFNQLLASNAQARNNLEVSEDAEFILGKINWAMSSAQSLAQPATNTTSAILDIRTAIGESRRFEVQGGDMVLGVAGGAPVRLNGLKTQITIFSADNIYDIDTNQILLKVRFKVDKRPEAGSIVPVTASTSLETTYAL